MQNKLMAKERTITEQIRTILAEMFAIATETITTGPTI
jgi:hypothetical protein